MMKTRLLSKKSRYLYYLLPTNYHSLLILKVRLTTKVKYFRPYQEGKESIAKKESISISHLRTVHWAPALYEDILYDIWW